MRIVTGLFRGRKLKSPKNNDVRPTSDKVKEAIFDMIYQFVPVDCVVFDVFAGSGNLGLEAISRGSTKVFFSDNSKESLALVRENAIICNSLDKCILLNGDFKRNIARVHEDIDVYFLDPPYADGLMLLAIDAILENNHLKDNGIIVCEHSHKEHLPEEYNGLECIRSRKYGATNVSIYRRKEDD